MEPEVNPPDFVAGPMQQRAKARYLILIALMAPNQ